ncbi:response regulator transcription factor [Nonomuraea sp. 3N208]
MVAACPGIPGTTRRGAHDVLRLIAQRLSNPEIAQRLYLSPRTVETHVSNLLAKAGASSRSGLAVLVESGPDKDL